MFNIFKCKHPAEWLVVRTHKPTVKVVDDYYDIHTLHLHCTRCYEDIDVSCAVIKDETKFQGEYYDMVYRNR